MKTIETVQNPGGVAVTLYQDEDGDFLMTGPTGQHRIDAGSDPQRVHAHWEGFCQMNDVSNKAMRLAAANPEKIKSSHATEMQVQRALYCMSLLESRLESLDMKAGTLKATWEDHGAAEWLLARLLDTLAPDGAGQRRALVAEIDAELEDAE